MTRFRKAASSFSKAWLASWARARDEDEEKDRGGEGGAVHELGAIVASRDYRVSGNANNRLHSFNKNSVSMNGS